MENRAFKGVWIPKEIWLSTELTEGEKLLLVEIDSLDGDQGCFATNEYFAKFFNKSPRQISRLINRLAQKGFISSEVIRGERNEVIRRVIHINPDTYPKYGHDAVGSVDEFDHRGMDGCVQYNNTKENNTTNYYYTEENSSPNGDPIPCVGKDSSTTEEATSSKVSDNDYYPPQPKASDDKERSGMDRMYTRQCAEVCERWNSYDVLPKCRGLTNKRKSHLIARMKEYSFEEVLQVVDTVPKSPWLIGENPGHWKAGFNWCFLPENFVKILEGTYLRDGAEETFAETREDNDAYQG